MSGQLEPRPPTRGRLSGLVGTRRRRLAAGALALVVVAGVILAVSDPFAGSAPSTSSDNTYPTSLATVKEETITQQTEQSATLGYAGSYTVAVPAGTASSQLTQDRSAVQADEQKVGADDQALSKARELAGPTTASTLMVAQATVTSDTTALQQARAQLAADERLSCPATGSGGAAGSPGGNGSTGNGSTGNGSTGNGSTGNGSTGNNGSSGASGAASSSSTTTTAPSSAGASGSGNGKSLDRRSASPVVARLTSALYSSPTASTGTGSATGSTTATVTGTVDPNGSDTSYAFEYGTTASFGSVTPSQDAGSGTSPVSVSADLTGLRPGTTYDFALVATNGAGTVVGPNETFQTSESSCSSQALLVTSDTEALSEAKDALAEDRLNADSSVTQAENALAGDEQSLSAAEQALSTDEARATNPGATFTAVPSSGEIIKRGQAVYSLDGRPVPLFYGTITPYRALYLGVSNGPDVRQLEENLAALGFLVGDPPSDQFSSATEAAVEAWQRSLGVSPTGVVALGDVIYEPGAIQVDTVSAATGQAVTGGLAVLTATSTVPEVTIDLDASQQSEVKVGDSVSIVLPDNSTTPGVVTSVGTVAVTPSSSSNNGGGSSPPTVTVEVRPTKLSALGDLSQASVNVWITTNSVRHALVVPVDALLALASGGYALEVVGADHVHHLVGVTVGLFDDADGTVQVSGAGVTAGERVVVPGL